MINFKNISKYLKGKSTQIFWFRTEEFNYLFTGYFGLRTKKTLHVEKWIFVPLINLFKTIPDIGTGFALKFDGRLEVMTEEQINNFIGLLELPKDAEVLTDTRLTQIHSDKDLQILKASKNYVYMDRTFMSFINEFSPVQIYGNIPTRPIYVTHENSEEMLMMLPVRNDYQPVYLNREIFTNEVNE
jgi:hypothetical protein